MFTSGKPLHDYQWFISNLTRLTVIFFFFLNNFLEPAKETWVGFKMQKFENVGLGGTNENFNR